MTNVSCYLSVEEFKPWPLYHPNPYVPPNRFITPYCGALDSLIQDQVPATVKHDDKFNFLGAIRQFIYQNEWWLISHIFAALPIVSFAPWSLWIEGKFSNTTYTTKSKSFIYLDQDLFNSYFLSSMIGSEVEASMTNYPGNIPSWQDHPSGTVDEKAEK